MVLIKHTDILDYDYTLEEVIHIGGNNCTVSSTNHPEHGDFNFFGSGAHIDHSRFITYVLIFATISVHLCGQENLPNSYARSFVFTRNAGTSCL